jgi:signal transduction histidine kinase
MTERAASMSGRLRGVRDADPTISFLHAVRTPAGVVTSVGAIVVLLLALLAATDLLGNGQTWQNAEWFVAIVTAVAASFLGARDAGGRERRVRALVGASIVLFAGGQVASSLASQVAPATPGGWPDLLRFAAAIPAVAALRIGIARRLRRSEEIAVYLDTLAILGTIVAVGCATIGTLAADSSGSLGLLFMAYPLLFMGMAGAVLVSALALRAECQPRGAYAIVLGYGLIGLAMVAWLHTPAALMQVNPILGLLFADGLLIVGIGGATWSELVDRRPTYGRWAKAIQMIITLGSVAVSGSLVLFDEGFDPRVMPIFLGAVGVTLVAAVARQTALLVDTGSMVDQLASLHIEAQAALDDMRRAQAQLLVASKRAAVGELAGAVAHEVNNPLTGVLGYAELLLADSEPDDRSRESLLTIRSEAIRARDIVRSLLEFARPRSPERRLTDLSELVRITVDLWRYHVERGGLQIVESYEALPEIDIDPDAIRQVVLNVLTNAIQAMPADGRLSVRVAADGADATIAIEDNGRGMSEETRLQAFQPFFSTREAELATGLGLSTAETLVESHGGRIELRSAVGEGTVATIRLPMTVPQVIAVASPSEPFVPSGRSQAVSPTAVSAGIGES